MLLEELRFGWTHFVYTSLPPVVYEGRLVALVQWYTGRIMADCRITQLTAPTETATPDRARTGYEYANVSRSARHRD